MEYLATALVTAFISFTFFIVGYKAGKQENIIPKKTKIEEGNFYD